jgi:hypothetical protein
MWHYFGQQITPRYGVKHCLQHLPFRKKSAYNPDLSDENFLQQGRINQNLYPQRAGYPLVYCQANAMKKQHPISSINPFMYKNKKSAHDKCKTKTSPQTMLTKDSPAKTRVCSVSLTRAGPRLIPSGSQNKTLPPCV